MRTILFAFLVGLTSMGYGEPAKISVTKKSSEIPERREFPLDESQSPCKSFYDNVCGGVINSFQLREDRSTHTFSFSDSAERILQKKMDYFKNLSSIQPADKKETNLKNYYVACMDTKNKSKDEKEEIKRVEDLTKNWKDRAQVSEWLSDSYLNTESSPLGWGPISNFEKPLTSDLYITTEYMTLPEKSYYKKADVMADFRKLVTSFFRTMGSSAATAKKQADAVLDYESKLAEVTPEPQEFRQIINNRSFISREDLLKRFAALKLEKFMAEVPANVVIRDWVPKAMEFSANYFSQAPIENIQALVQFHTLYPLIDDSNPKFFNEKFEFDKKHLGGPNKRPDRQERCTRLTMHTFLKEVDSVLMARMFPNFDREKFVSLAEKIRGSILSSLERNTWLTKEAKAEAVQKMKKAKLYLISPENDKQWDFLPDADYVADHPVKNSKTVSMVMLRKNLKDLREAQDQGRWDMGPLTVNAYYDPSYNKFVMPIGILQYPFYDASSSIEENLAAVGSVMGHELGHGVDDQGARYDSDGKQRQWMGMKDLAEFSKRTEFLVNQYTTAGMNGKLTLGENIGDLVGVTASYDAAMLEPGFKDSPERKKSFFRAYARVWCQVQRPKFTEMRLKTDPHSQGYARANEPLKHSAAFQEVFQCKDGDPMTLPKESRVRIW